MIKEYRTIQQGGSSEVIEKKSKFIAQTGGIESEEDALLFVDKVKKQYENARHHCFAYVLGEKDEIQRYSDDGEPSATAGKPILDVIKGEGLHNAIIVVTRYFGGTLLGTGGLIRAYSSAAKAGLLQSEIVTKKRGVRLKMVVNYDEMSKIQYTFKQRKISLLNTTYTDVVTAEVVLPFEDIKRIVEEITEITCGKAIIKEEGECYIIEKEPKH